jgi:hypothetical protein
MPTWLKERVENQMFRWLIYLFLIVTIGFFGTAALQSYQKGYFNMPDMPEGAYVYSRKDGMRGIVLNAEVSRPATNLPKYFRQINVANTERRFFGIPFEVTSWLEDVWSVCTPPSKQERVDFPKVFSESVKQDLAYARFDAVCRIDVDGEIILRGLLYSIPKL